MKPDQLLIIAAVGVGAYFLYTKMGSAAVAAPAASSANTGTSSGSAMPGAPGVSTSTPGAVGAKVDPSTFPTVWTPGASVPISAGAMSVFQGASGFSGLSSSPRKRPTVQPGVVPVRANPVSQRNVGWNV